MAEAKKKKTKTEIQYKVLKPFFLGSRKIEKQEDIKNIFINPADVEALNRSSLAAKKGVVLEMKKIEVAAE